jgi:hypothetical protein
MINRLTKGLIALVLATGLGNCTGSGGSATPMAPSPVPQAVQPAATLSGVSLSGLVYELTPKGPMPVAGIAVYCERCGKDTHTFAYTDADGDYLFSGDLDRGGGVWLSPGNRIQVQVVAKGYSVVTSGAAGSQGVLYVLIDGSTRLDIQLLKD